MTVQTGKLAEQAAAEYLVRSGYMVIARNWRTKACEIDIVACKDSCMHFVEVKYRASSTQGTGLEYVTPAKLRRMAFAAGQWVRANNWEGEVNLAAVEVAAPDYTITDFIESIY